MITASEAAAKALAYNMQNANIEQYLEEIGQLIEEQSAAGQNSAMYSLLGYNLTPLGLSFVKKQLVAALNDYGYDVVATAFELYINW